VIKLTLLALTIGLMIAAVNVFCFSLSGGHSLLGALVVVFIFVSVSIDALR
jgi:hypothetical protein